MNNFELKGKLILRGIIVNKTGLHIGGMSETLKIGGSDNPVIKDRNGNIFIPGSSLKGKIRSLMEISGYAKGTDYKSGENGKPCECGELDCTVCMLFGPHNSENIKEPGRAIVRDAYLKPNGKITYEYLETKPENVIDRVKGTAQHPRFIERVVADSEFEYEVVFNIFKESDKELVKKFIEGMKLLEDDYLGGSGSRGYGKILFKDLNWEYRPKSYYEGEGDSIKSKILSLNELSNAIDEIVKIN